MTEHVGVFYLVRHTTLTLALPAAFAISPWVLFAIAAVLALSDGFGKCLAALWKLPDWVHKWLDVRDRWRRP